MTTSDVLSLVGQHHFEFAIPLSLAAFGLRTLLRDRGTRIMPIFFGFALSPLFSASVLHQQAFSETFPAYVSHTPVFELNDPMWAALYMPAWGACAALAIFHPLVTHKCFSRPLLWLIALALACYQAHLFATDVAPR